MSGCGLRPVRHLGFDLADRFVERQTLAHDLRFRERRPKTAELNHQGPPRVLVKRTSGLVGVLVKAGNGSGDELIVIGHGRLEMSDTRMWRLIALEPLGATLRVSPLAFCCGRRESPQWYSSSLMNQSRWPRSCAWPHVRWERTAKALRPLPRGRAGSRSRGSSCQPPARR